MRYFQSNKAYEMIVSDEEKSISEDGGLHPRELICEHDTFISISRFKWLALFQIYLAKWCLCYLAKLLHVEGSSIHEGEPLVFLRHWEIRKDPDRGIWQGYFRGCYAKIPPTYTIVVRV